MDKTFSVGFGLTSALSMPSDDELASGLKPGGGMNLYLGWRLSNWAAVDLEWFTTFHATSFPALTSTAEDDEDEDKRIPAIENAMLSSFSGLVRIYFLNPGFFEPYAIVGASFFVLTRGLNSTDGLPGLGFCTGLGAAFNLNETMGIGARVLYRGAFFDNTEYPIPLPGAPEQSAFINLLVMSAHVRLNF